MVRKVTKNDIKSIRKMHAKGTLSMRKIARGFSISYQTVNIYVKYNSLMKYDNDRTRARGFNSLLEYRDVMAQRKGFVSLSERDLFRILRRGFSSRTEYQNHLAKKRGFSSWAEYQKVRREKIKTGLEKQVSFKN